MIHTIDRELSTVHPVPGPKPPERRLRIERPLESAEPQPAKPAPRNRRVYLFTVLFVLIPLVLFACGWILFMMGPPSSAGYPFGVRRFSGPVLIRFQNQGDWIPITRVGQAALSVRAGDHMKSEKDGEIDLILPGRLDLRLKEWSHLQMAESRRRLGGETAALKLHAGLLLGRTAEGNEGTVFEFETPHLRVSARNVSFGIRVSPERSSATVLRGRAEVYSKIHKKSVWLEAFQGADVGADPAQTFQPAQIDFRTWRALNEIRDWDVVSPEEAERQIDLRKQAGSFFDYVFDEGTFFRPNWGYARREFFEDEGLKKVILRIDYDVFPEGAYSGMYFKTRGVDLSNARRLSFDLRAEEGAPAPDEMTLELKGKFSTLRRLTVKPVTKEWSTYSFDLSSEKPAVVSEAALVFEQARVGDGHSSGTVYLKDLNFEAVPK